MNLIEKISNNVYGELLETSNAFLESLTEEQKVLLQKVYASGFHIEESAYVAEFDLKDEGNKHDTGYHHPLQHIADQAAIWNTEERESHWDGFVHQGCDY